MKKYPWYASLYQNKLRKKLGFVTLLFPIILFLPGIVGKVPYPSSSAVYSDFSISHFPYALYIKKSFLEYGQIPLWADYLYSGMPLAGNPLASLWYPPQWIALLLPLPGSLSLLAALHCGLGGYGVFHLLLKEGISEEGALLGGLAFGFLPKIYAHYGAGHLTLVYAVAWTPWLLKAAWSDKPFIWSGVIFGLIILADPRWAPYAGLAWILYWIIAKRYRVYQLAIRSIITGGIAVFLSAPFLMPFIQFIRRSTRVIMDSQDSLTGSLDPAGLFGLILPSWGGSSEVIGYIGAGGFLAALVVFTKAMKNSSQFYWPVIFIFGCVLALGENLPGSEFMQYIPLISLGRVPARSLFLTGFASAVMIGIFFSFVQRGEIRQSFSNYLGFGFLVIGSTLVVFFLFSDLVLPATFFWGASMLVFAGAAFIGSGYQRLKTGSLIILFLVIGIDYIFIDLNSIVWKLDYPDQVGKYIRSLVNDEYRIYSPSYSLTQISTVKNGLEIADGVDPMQINSYRELFETASGVPYQRYSVSLPPFKTGQPKIDNLSYNPNPDLLGLLNVKYLVSHFPLEDAKLNLVQEINENFLYQNSSVRPRTWVEEQGFEGDEQEILPANILVDTPNRIVVSAEGPGTLILSEVDYPGWLVKVNGTRKEIHQAYGVLRSVDIYPGSNLVEFQYRPQLVFIGLLFSGVGILCVIWILTYSKNEKIHN